MRQLFLLLTLIAVTMGCLADSFEKRVHTYMTSNGEVFFVGHKKLSKASAGVKHFEYDLTYVEGRDSVTLNFTVVSPNPTDVSALTLSNGQKTIEAGAIALIYHDVKKKTYEVRTTSKVLFADLSSLLTADAPVRFGITRTDGQEQQVEFTASEWKKENELYKKVFYLIKK